MDRLKKPFFGVGKQKNHIRPWNQNVHDDVIEERHQSVSFLNILPKSLPFLSNPIGELCIDVEAMTTDHLDR